MAEPAKDPLVDFRSSLEDVIAVADKLAAHCSTVGELVDMLKLALDSDGQAKWLLTLVTAKKYK